MAAHRLVYGFGPWRGDCIGPGSAPEAYTLISIIGLMLPLTQRKFEKLSSVRKGRPVNGP